MNPLQVIFNMNLHTLAMIAMLTSTVGFVSGYGGTDNTSIITTNERSCEEPAENMIDHTSERFGVCDEDSVAYRQNEQFLRPLDNLIYKPWYEVGHVWNEST